MLWRLSSDTVVQNWLLPMQTLLQLMVLVRKAVDAERSTSCTQYIVSSWD